MVVGGAIRLQNKIHPDTKTKKKKKKQNSWSSSAEDVDTWKRGLNVETYACF
jgi:hypothetical protein